MSVLNRRLKERTWTGLISPTELSETFGVPIGTIYRWNHLRTGPKVLHVGKHVRYRLADVEAWLEAQAAEQTAS